MKPSRLPEAAAHGVRCLEQASIRHCPADPRRDANEFVRAICGAEDAGHPSIENRDDVLDSGELSRLYKPAQKLDCCGVDELVGFLSLRPNGQGWVDCKAGTLPDQWTFDGAAWHENSKHIPQHVWSSRREKSNGSFELLRDFIDAEQVKGVFGVEAVNLLSIDHVDLPAEPLEKYRSPHSEHLIEEFLVQMVVNTFNSQIILVSSF